MTIHELRLRLQNAEGGDQQFTAKCPAHDDRHNSLSVGVSDDGKKLLLHCHAGCTTEAIVAALHLQMSDLFTERAARAPQKVGERRYEYRDADGQLLYVKTRVDYDDRSKTFCFTQPNGAKGVKGVQRVPYNLPAVLAVDTVYFVEGEKAADALIQAGRTATTLDGGANSKWDESYAGYFEGKRVIVIPDNDAPGMKYARCIAKHLQGAQIIQLPGLPPKGDIYDWLRAGHTVDELDALQPIADEAKEPAAEKEPRTTQAEVLLRLVDETGARFFHSDTDDLYAAIPVKEHAEIWPLEGRDFAVWLHRLYYEATRRPAGNEAVGQALAVLSAVARFGSPEPVTLSTRAAECGGAFWYDMTNPAWQAVEVRPDGWRVCDRPPVMFTRYRHQAAQVTPQPGGDVRRILRHVNVKGCDTLFLCWLVSCFVPGIPHAMPIFYGEKGAAKSTVCGLLKALIDPSALETLTLQNDPRTLAVNLQQHWFLPFDNVSHINEETSDTLCRAVTGGGIQHRKLFTNADDTIFTFKRCLALNGINNVATRSDLLDRSLLIELERIPDTDRREMREVQAAFEADRPSILGGIFDVLARAMAIYPTVKLDRLPRMADFSRWGYAIGEALGGLGQEFLNQYDENRAAQNAEAINSDPVATLVVVFMSDRDTWEGKVAELLTALSGIAPLNGINTRDKSFPSRPNHLSRRLRGIKSNLESIGIRYENGGHGRQGTHITLNRDDSSSLSSHRHKASEIGTFSRDDNVTINDGHILSSPLSSRPKAPNLGHCDDGDGRDDKIATFGRDLRRGRI